MNLLYLSFYFTPDQCPGAFRNAELVRELARQLGAGNHIHVLTTQPNRYASYRPPAAEVESWEETVCTVTIERVSIPTHANGFADQARAFRRYFRMVLRIVRQQQYTAVFASSSRLFTAFLAARVARSQTIPLLLDVRDLFREAILDVLTRRWKRIPALGWLLRYTLNPALRVIERYAFGYAAHINLVSEGFRLYFTGYPSATYSFFTNGIDELFVQNSWKSIPGGVKTILYAGNIGDGQGLHHIIPQTAQLLGSSYRFIIIGDGGARRQLERAIRQAGITNVELRKPVSRNALIDEYRSADYLLLHLNDLDACRRVLPSKLFEYGATDKPILAGVTGYAAEFVTEHLPNSLVFPPGNAQALTTMLHNTPYKIHHRSSFRQEFCRTKISQAMALLILQVIAGEMLTNACRKSAQKKPACRLAYL